MSIISIINNKGGVAKTTTAFTLGAFLAKKGKKVLLIDVDAQMNLTEKGMSQDEFQESVENDDYTIIDFLSGSSKLPSFYSNEDGTLMTMKGDARINDFLTINKELSPEEYNKRRNLFKNKVNMLKVNFDYVILDCAPGMFNSENLLTPTEVVLLGTDFVIVPANDGKDSVLGLYKVFDAIKRIKKENSAIKLLGMVLTIVNKGELVFQHYRDYTKELIGDFLFETYIRRSADMKKALEENISIFDYDKNSIAAIDYENFGEEVLSRIKNYE